MSLSPADLARLAGGMAPILCADTCSILDILRDPTRETFGAHDAQAALALIAAFANNRAHCLLAEQVRTEFSEHVDQIEQDTAAALGRLEKKLNHVHQLATILGASGALDVSTLQGHAGRGRAVEQDGGESGTDGAGEACRRLHRAQSFALRLVARFD